MSTVNISAHISPELSKILDVVSKMEERSKSYYIQKGLKMILERKLEDIEDLKEIEDYEKIKEHKEYYESYNRLEDEDRIMTFPISIGPELNFKNRQEFMNWLFSYIGENNEREEKVATIEDVKNQLTILINQRFSNFRDRRDFRSDLLPLLKELE